MPPGGLGEMISPRPPQSGGTVFRAETLCFFSTKHSTAVPSESVVPLFMSWNGKRPPLVFFTRNRRLPSENNPLRLRLFSCETGKLPPRSSPPRLRNRFPTRLQKSWEGEGWGLGRGEGSLSSERFPLPSPSSQNIKNARVNPIALVGGEGLEADFEVAGIDRGAVHGFDFADGEFPLVP